MNKNKLKYISFGYDISHEELKEDFNIVSNPTKYNNLPDGEYLIRGNKKSHSKEYWVKDNIWYLVNETTEDNSHYYVRACTYNLFPSLPEKEWEVLNNPIVISKLNNYWQRALFGYNFWMELRNNSRQMKYDFMIFEKNNSYE